MSYKIGDLHTLSVKLSQQYYTLFDKRPVLEDGIWLAQGPTKRIGYILANKDYFVLFQLMTYRREAFAGAV